MASASASASSTSKETRKYELLTLTLTIPTSERIQLVSSSTDDNLNTVDQSHCSNSTTKPQSQPQKPQQHQKKYSKQQLLKQKWDSLCQKWGMIVIRELVFIQDAVLVDEMLLDEEQCEHENGMSSSSSIMIDGCEATKVKDQLVISEVLEVDQQQQQNQQHSNSTKVSAAQKAGIQPGDIIHAIYGMTNPTLPLLFGTMRNSFSFQITIKRQHQNIPNTSLIDMDTSMNMDIDTDVGIDGQIKNITNNNTNDNNINDNDSDKTIMDDDKTIIDDSDFPGVDDTEKNDIEKDDIEKNDIERDDIERDNTQKDGIQKNDDMVESETNIHVNLNATITCPIAANTSNKKQQQQAINNSDKRNDYDSNNGNSNSNSNDNKDKNNNHNTSILPSNVKNNNKSSISSSPNNKNCNKRSTTTTATMTAATSSNNEIAPKKVGKCTMSNTKHDTDKSKNTTVSINTPQKSQPIHHTSNYENDEYGQFPITNFDIIDKLVEEREILRSSQKEEKQQQSHDDVDINNDDDDDNEDNHEENKLLNNVAESIASDAKKENNNNKKSEKAEQTQKKQQRNSSKSSTSRSTSQFCHEQNASEKSVQRTFPNIPKIPTTAQSSSRATEDTSRRLRSNSRSNSPMITKHSKEPTFFRQSNTHVASTSNKAGLSIIKHTKLKRLWPDSFVFAKKILKCSPPSVRLKGEAIVQFNGPIQLFGKKESLPVIPTTFRDSPDLIKHMTPHILEEGINSLNQEFSDHSRAGLWLKKTFDLYLRSCTPVEPKTASSSSVRLYEFAFHVDCNKFRPPTNLGEIFAIYSPSCKRSFLGLIGSNDMNSTFLKDQKTENEDSFDLCKLWIGISNADVQNSGWLPESEMPSRNGDGSFMQEKMHAINIGTCTDMMRQYEGLKSLDCIKANLKRAVFCNSIKGSTVSKKSMTSETPPQPAKPSSVIAQVWNMISKQTNPYQLSAIETVMLGKVKDNVTLLQGPPGTGKTLTIVSLVGALLNGSVPISGAKNPRTAGTKVQIGKALSSDKAPILNAPVARRILICSPSNQSVDDLAWKLHRNAIGTDGKPGSFNIIRFGMLPGEERHDGRGKKPNPRITRGKKSLSERDDFLHRINLDNIIKRIADDREINDFGHRKDSSNAASAFRRHSRFINYNEERQKKLSECHVICTTLSGAGSKAFAEAVSRDEFPQSEFDAVIIDEACQGSEMACLIPLKFNPNAVVLVGDPKQLPVMTFTKDAERCKADRSLFERLQENGWPVHLLRYQYRMHESIASFPSRMFYDNLLVTSDCVRNRGPAAWHHHHAFPPYLFWNVGQGTMKRGNRGGYSNQIEANFLCALLKSFRAIMRGIRGISIGVISFYNDQVSLIENSLINNNKSLMSWMRTNNITLQISTVDGFQGSEKDIIILSCVRSKWHREKSSNEIGFLKDVRRVNVALTRAKHSLWILGNSDVLHTDELWNSLLTDAFNRDLIAQSSQLVDFAHEDEDYSQRNHNKRQRPNKSDNGPSKKKRKKWKKR